MIEFVTLLLGLATGTQTVELSVDEGVALVELRLDGRFAGGLSSPPWWFDIDFGEQLAPHELLAIAYDEERNEVRRIRQWVNLPRERFEARLAVERTEGKSAVARLIWAALDYPRPAAVHLAFDGVPLPVEDPERVALPDHDPAGLHFLRAEIEFSQADRAYAELAFGGTYGEAVHSELTAVVFISERRRAPRPDDMAGWLERDGRALNVVAVERGPANLIVVRERSAATHRALRKVAEQARRARKSSRARLPQQQPVVGERDRVRFVYPTAGRQATPVGQGLATLDVEQVPVSRDVEIAAPEPVRPPVPGRVPRVPPASGGDYESLLAALADVSHEESPEPAHQLADAVAIAGVVAAAGDRRRMVLLVRAGDAEDDSRFTAGNVRGYLARLGVPLTVWSVGESAPSPWGEETGVSDLRAMNRALDDLREALEQQVVVWVEGAHLPHQAELAEKAEGLRRPGEDG